MKRISGILVICATSSVGVVGLPAPAQAAGCTTSWLGGAGSWSDASKWSAGVPSSTSDACVKANGTYTVVLDHFASGGSVTVKTLSVGGGTGAQTLAVTADCSANVVLTSTSGVTVAATGVLRLTSSGCGSYVLFSSSLTTVSGALVTDVGAGGTRYLRSDVSNVGTVTIGAASSLLDSGNVLTNSGAFNVLAGGGLTVSGGSVLANASGGTISAAGTVTVNGGTYTQGAGTTTGNPILIAYSGTVNYTGSGASTVDARGSVSLNGNISSGQTLTITGDCSVNTAATTAGAFTNAGVVNLTSSVCGSYSLLSGTGLMTNTGQVNVQVGAGGLRYLRVPVSNSGTVAITQPTAYDTALTFTNNGSLAVGTAGTFNMTSGSTLSNAGGGSISGTGQVVVNSATYNQGAGTTSGNPVLVGSGGTVSYSGAGASSVDARGTVSLSGDLAAGQSLTATGDCSVNTGVTAAASFTNAGSITLTSSGCGSYALLAGSGLLTNTGALTSAVGSGGARYLRMSTTNLGSLTVNQTLQYDAGGTTLTNKKTLTVTPGAQLNLNQTLTNDTGGLIASSGTGQVVVQGGTYNQGKGKTTGNPVLSAYSGTVNFTGAGASTVDVRGSSTVNGTIAAAQKVNITGDCVANAHTVFNVTSNAGTLSLTSVGCGSYALIAGPGTLTNTGTLKILAGAGGARYVRVNVVNALSLAIDAGATMTQDGAQSYTQTSTGAFTTTVGSAGPGRLSSNGSVTLDGTIVANTAKGFVPTLGSVFTPVSGATRSGSFATIQRGAIGTSGRYYLPGTTATTTTLTTVQATFNRAPTSGHAGSAVTLTGAGFLPGETVTLSFKDKNLVVTPYASVVANGSGGFSVGVTVPAGAALGAGKFLSKGLTSVALPAKGFTVN